MAGRGLLSMNLIGAPLGEVVFWYVYDRTGGAGAGIVEAGEWVCGVSELEWFP